MCAPDSRFYVAVNPKYVKGGALSEVWFINQQLGKNQLGSIAKTMSEDAGFTVGLGRYSPYRYNIDT